MDGTGKTELAWKLAEEVGTASPDGYVYIELRGTTARTLSPAEALARAIRAFETQASMCSDTNRPASKSLAGFAP